MTSGHLPSVARGDRYSAALIADHGRTYYLAAQLLPVANRRGVSALYGFARIVDDIVDHADDAPAATLAHLDAVLAAFDVMLAAGPSADLSVASQLSPVEADVVAAAAATARRWSIPAEYFTAFGRSMRMDVPGAEGFVNRYRTLEQLRCYTYGSASVIGLQLLPLLGVGDCAPHSPTATSAALLGEAFQLTNFLRDVGEDLDRDRIYLPTDELLAFGVDEAHLRRCRVARSTSPQLRRAVAHLTALNRDLYRRATPGITLLPRRIRPAIAAAAASYAEILTVIESPATDVMATRAVVSRRRRLQHAVASLGG